MGPLNVRCCRNEPKRLLFQKVLDILKVRTFLLSSFPAHFSSAPHRVWTCKGQQNDSHESEDGGDLVRRNNVKVCAILHTAEPSGPSLRGKTFSP